MFLRKLHFAGDWLQEHTDLRDLLLSDFTADSLRQLARTMQERIETCGRAEPLPKLSERARQRLEQDAIKRQRIEEELRLEGEVVKATVRNLLQPKAVSPPVCAASNKVTRYRC